MKLGSCIHLEKVNPMLNFEFLSTFYGSLTYVEYLHLGHFFSETIRARAMKLGSCIRLEE